MRCRVKIDGEDCEFSSVERSYYLADAVLDLGRDAYGFWNGNIVGKRNEQVIALSMKQLLNQERQIIVIGEGDSGKSVAMRDIANQAREQGCVFYAMLRAYRGEKVYNLWDEIREEGERAKKKSAKFFVVLDGMDENEMVLDPLAKFIKGIQRQDWCFVLSSRPIDGLRHFIENVGFKEYRMASFMMRDVEHIAGELGVDWHTFFKVASEKLVLGMCQKPELCIQLLRLHSLGKLKMRTIKDLFTELSIDLCREHRDGLPEQSAFRSDDFSNEEIDDALSWIAVVLSLQKKKEISTETTSNNENDILVSDLVTDEYKKPVILAVMEGRLFEPMSSTSYRVGVEDLIPFLAAKWFEKHMSHDNIRTLLVDRTNPETGRLYAVLGWVEVFVPGIAGELMYERPELILLTKESIKRNDIKILYRALLRRYWKLPHEERRARIVLRLHHLKGLGVDGVIRRELESKDVKRLMFAAEVVKECVMTEMTSYIVDVILDNSIDVEVRESLSYALLRLSDNNNDDSIARLRSILDVKIEGQLSENIWANILRCLYPKYLSLGEVLHLLRDPLAANYYGAYAAFIKYVLPQSFNVVINEQNAPVALDWSAQHIYKDKIADRLGSLAREIFTFCWRFASCGAVQKSIVKCILAYFDNGKFGLPFLSSKESHHVHFQSFNREVYFQQRKERLKVFFDVVNSVDSKKHCSQLNSLVGSYRDFPLVIEDDFEDVARMVIANLQGQPLLTELLGNLTSHIDLDKHSKTLERLKDLFPEDTRFDKKEIKKRLRPSKKQNEKCEYQSRKHTERNREEEIRYREWMHTSVRDAIVDRYASLVYTIGEANGNSGIPPIDIRESIGWELFDEQERDNFVNMGAQYLQRLNAEVGIDGVVVCCAVKLSCSQIFGFNGFDLIEKGWERLFRILVKNEPFWHSDEDVLKIVYELHSKVVGCHAILIDVIVNECFKGYINPLSIFSSLLSSVDVNEIITRLHEKPPSDLYFSRIIKTLAQLGEYANVYVSRLFTWSSKNPPCIEQSNMLRVAVELSPTIRMKSILRWIRLDETWGREWLESALSYHQADEFVEFVLKCQPSQIAAFLIFLDKVYPDALESRHRNELAYSPDGIDKVFELKGYLINALVKCNTDDGVKALRRVARMARTKKWDRIANNAKCVRRVAREKAVEAMLPPITLKELKFFLHPKNQRKVLIYTSESLRRFLERVLGDFNKWLRMGAGTKNAVILWRRIRKGNVYCWQNKDELSLSDEINKFIKKKAVSLSAFREPLVSYYFKNGKRHRGFADLVVHAQDPHRVKAPAEVIIEVKGNWNREVRTGLKSQLVNHYLKNLGHESHGIFLCGCFNLERAVKGYRDKEEAQKNLEDQRRKLGRPWRERVGISVLDCSLEGVP